MRNVFGILLLALLVYFIATQPLLAAETTTSAAGSLKSGADSLITFYSEMRGPTSPATPENQQLPGGTDKDCTGRANGVYGVQGRVFTCPAAVRVPPPPGLVNPDGSVG
jgi:hypothetical protein